jgi:hypothetical protein
MPFHKYGDVFLECGGMTPLWNMSDGRSAPRIPCRAAFTVLRNKKRRHAAALLKGIVIRHPIYEPEY